MASSQMAAILSRTRTLLLHRHRHHHLTKSITTFHFLSQEPQLAEPSPPPTTTTTTTSLPPNPSGSPLYNENSLNPQSLPHPLLNPQSSLTDSSTLANCHDSNSLLDLFADWTASQRWADITALFEAWVRSRDIKTGKLNKPDVNLFNNYLRAKLMNGASADEMVDLVEQMVDFRIAPNLVSFNLVLKAYQAANEAVAAEKLIELIELMERAEDAVIRYLEQKSASADDSNANQNRRNPSREARGKGKGAKK